MPNHTDPFLVSVITATWNSAKTLRRCLQSVQQQDYPAIEHLIVDGGSTDGTLDILREEAAPNLRWHSEPDNGIYDAWNKGLARAHGEWVAFLGSDDIYLPGAVSAYMALAAANPGTQYLSGQVRWIGPNGPRTIGQPWSWPRFQRYMTVAHVGSMHHRSLFQQYGTYDTSLRIVADYELLLRAKGNLRAAYLPQLTTQMQSGGASDSAAALRETRRVKQQTGGRSALASRFDHVVASVLFRKRMWMA